MIANLVNELGRKLQDRGSHKAADLLYALAAMLAPTWSAPWFNRGLMAKFRSDWPECYRLTLMCTELDPEFKPAWWNLGIAATALSDWGVARRAWWRYGIAVPLGSGPPDMDLGSVPIRICPDTLGEVVWCKRLDPARASILSVPLPQSAHAHGDVLLTDGEPKGYRSSAGTNVPVFNELEVLVPSDFRTYSAQLVVPSEEDSRDLVGSTSPDAVRFEDWSGIRMLCTACSEGSPGQHEHQHHETGEWQVERSFGIAARDKQTVESELDAWLRRGNGRKLASLECVFTRV